ncbi:lysM domain receptor-like kinase 3 [Cucurbita pepo subsp. pepo]|uniref:lysM domain receptor-like kinase 3 n=1 Tax=Cucurbita pepo subsp. pepo TaxID=3664 RepID=UPI000C9D91CB|nr:lysM domain receptor-like kinase 3 [Cucurbita pepo subsp. pepo]
MCKTKKSTDVIDPPSPRSSRHQRMSKSNASSSYVDPSSSVNFTSYNISTTDTKSSTKSSSKSSSSSRASLVSLKNSLPDNPLIYEFSEIRSATNNFLSKPFSSSSSSSSWRCLIRGKDAIVFQRKLLRPIELPELKHQLSVIGRSHHNSLVKLLGASISGDYVYLVYEFIVGANLAECLRNPRNPNFTVLSTWISRMQIATDLAHGLDYIHHCSGLNSKFIHNHIKSSSIVITEETLTPKICHFGTAELCGETAVTEEENEEEEEEEGNESEITTYRRPKRPNVKKIKLEGTRGYIAPEMMANGTMSQKIDVYAFGVLILELISGDEALKFILEKGNRGGGYVRVSVIETARKAVENGTGGIRTWVDRRLMDSFPVEVAEKMVVVGLECVEEDPDKRPGMGRVAGKISKLFLESSRWAESIGKSLDMSVSLAPR